MRSIILNLEYRRHNNLINKFSALLPSFVSIAFLSKAIPILVFKRSIMKNKLRKKFNEAFNGFDYPIDFYELTEKCISIAEQEMEMAKEETAIGFTKWSKRNNWSPLDSDKWTDMSTGIITSKELYQLYMKEKNNKT